MLDHACLRWHVLTQMKYAEHRLEYVCLTVYLSWQDRPVIPHNAVHVCFKAQHTRNIDAKRRELSFEV